jgi:hypothetical protein
VNTKARALAKAAARPCPRQQRAHAQNKRESVQGVDLFSLELPETLKLLQSIRPTDATHHMAWETLTHAEIGAVGLPQAREYPNQFSDEESGWGWMVAKRVARRPSLRRRGPSEQQRRWRSAKGGFVTAHRAWPRRRTRSATTG